MDPTESLKDILKLCDDIDNWWDNLKTETPVTDAEYEMYALSQKISDLHHWIIKGGALPKQWQPN